MGGREAVWALVCKYGRERETVRRGGHVPEAGGAAVRNTGLDQEETPAGGAGQNGASDGQLGGLRTPHPSFFQHLL